ncbi:hypothetical protein U1872_06395 [Sphingomonas sp. RB3P16]|uniref:hypothetical protein n=1 Tax=Parasphingomonas frigoris TaxID=3096163 RepID=UPI002FCA2396
MLTNDGAPIREDVTQADREAAEDAYLSCFEPQPNDLWLKALLDGKHDNDEVVQFCRRHRLAHTARPDAGDEVERVLTCEYGEDEQSYALCWENGWAITAFPSGRVVVTKSPREVAYRAFGCDVSELAAMREGVDRGMVEVPRVLPVSICDAMTEVKVSDGQGGFTALNWEEAEQVWEAALAALSRKRDPA